MSPEERAGKTIDEALARGLIDEDQARKARAYVSNPFTASKVIDRIVSLVEDAVRKSRKVKQF